MKALATGASPQLSNPGQTGAEVARFGRGGVENIEVGITPLTAGQLIVEVAFGYEKGAANYIFSPYPYVKDPNDPPQIITAVVVSQSRTGFVAKLSAAPDTELSTMCWGVALVDTKYVNDVPGGAPTYAIFPEEGFSVSERKIFVPTMAPYYASPEDIGDAAIGIQSALDDAAAVRGTVYLPGGTYKLLSGLTIPSGVRLSGSGWATDTLRPVSAPNGGTWFHITTDDFVPVTIAGPSQGAGFFDVGFYHDHDAPGTGWEPTIYPYVIKLQNAGVRDTEIRNICLFNCTHGIQQDNAGGTAERLKIHEIYGQPLVTGIVLEGISDVTRVQDIHFWYYWAGHADVASWMYANNATGIRLGTVDQPQINNIFCFGYDSVIQIEGTTSHCQGVSINGDSCNSVIRVLSSGGGHSYWANVRGGGGVSGSKALIDFQGDGYFLSIANLTGDQLPGPCIKVGGASNTCKIVNFFVYAYGRLTGTSAAVENNGATNVVEILQPTYDPAGQSTGGLLGGTYGYKVRSGPRIEWIAPTLLNSWVEFGGSAETTAYTRDVMGFGRLKGLIKSGVTTNGITAFLLPVGFRPMLDQTFMVASNDQIAFVVVASTGQVLLYGVSNVYVNLANIHYYIG